MIESIVSFFTVGTFGFWLLIALASIVFTAFTENEKYWFPSIVAIGLGVAYWKPFMSVVDWKVCIVGLIVYGIIGMAWSAYRWLRYVKKSVEDYASTRALTQEGLKEWADYKLQISTNRSKIMGWIAYWPWSMLWNLTGDFFTALFDAMKGVYEKIAQAVLAKAMSKLPNKIEDKRSDLEKAWTTRTNA